MSFALRGALVTTAIAVSIFNVGASLAQESLTLKVTHVFPANHYLWEKAGKVFADKVTAATNGKVTFEVYPSGQLGKDSVGALRSGLADFAILIPSYQPDKMPLTSVAELPGLYSSSCEGSDKFWELLKEGGVLSEGEYKPQDVRVLYASTITPYKLMTTNKRVTSLDHVAGLKIRAGGPAMDKTIRALGGVPVRLSSPELYDALSRGTLDGALYPYSGLLPFDLEKLLHHSVGFDQLGAGSNLFAISERRWASLPEDVKNAMTEAARDAHEELCRFQDTDEQAAGEQIVAEDGHEVTKLAEDEAAIWLERVSSVADEWAKEMDAAGRSGSAALKAFREAASTR